MSFDLYYLLRLDRYDLLHNGHLNLEGLDELFKVAQVQKSGDENAISVYHSCPLDMLSLFDLFPAILQVLFLCILPSYKSYEMLE